ncbi:methylated-DNA--[protein]-cysteine S-methyltransferase [Vibrio sp. S11_S32]|uniref:methylated-DNA--[protein]-cysteine S-methyltransferase n=1 Tax=Vibrio sp. S11_S32 TaxID=2720225 RepID=UPI001EEED96B|nr:methylated-DNA--[protein]-cysteine S-methyltransferase [Vibrio sp. S11_S32]
MLKIQTSETEKTVFTTMPSPYGGLTIQSNSQGLLGLWLVTYTTKPDQLGEYVAREQLQTALPPQAILAQTVLQLEQYFSGQRAQFDLPLAATGTAFQQQVWQALTDIPYGETCSYQDIANAIGNPKAVRAVGLANGKNPISIIVPCHRVIGKNGKLTGYAGGVEVKQGLLETEARNK